MRKLLVLLGVVAIAMFAMTSGALARQGERLAAAAHPRVLTGTLDRERVDGPGWVLQNLPWNRGQGGGEDSRYGGHRQSFSCDGTFTGITVRDVVVGPSDVCLLTNSVIRGDVRVQSNGDFEAGNTSIRGDVEGNQALTIYLYDGSNVGGQLETWDTAQVFAFNSAVGDGLSVIGSTDQVFLCNNTVGRGIAVLRSGPDILVGDHLDPNCAGNVVEWGNIVVSQNATYVELVVGDNSVMNGSMFVTGNTGTPVFTSGESVLGNQGRGALFCFGNVAPFVGSPNPGWFRYAGQCSA